MSIWNDMSWVPALRTPFFNVFFEGITLMGYPLFLILFLCFGYYLLGQKRFFHTAMLLIIAGLINSWLKDFGQDPRPDIAYALDPRTGGSYGWPSGHMQIAVVLWGYLAYSMQNKMAYAAAAIFIALQGFSRLYLGVHDLGDVTAGLIFGVICLYGYIWVSENPSLSQKIQNLTLPQGIAAILALHLIYMLVYPTHEGHDVPHWFVGMMLGWYIGWRLITKTEMRLPGPVPVQWGVGSLLTGVCFVAMLVTTRLPAQLGLKEGLAAAASLYVMGVVFGMIVIWALPRLVSKLSDTVKS